MPSPYFTVLHMCVQEICMHMTDSGHAKRVLTYWEKWGTHDNSKINVSIVPMENYIFLERRGFPFSKNIVFHGYYGDIFLAVNMIFPIFPTFPCTLVPFSRGWNQLLCENCIRMHEVLHTEFAMCNQCSPVLLR